MDRKPGIDIIVLHQAFSRGEHGQFMLDVAKHGAQWNIFVGMGTEKPTCQNRNRICHHFLESGPAHDILMMLDHDVQPQKNPLDIAEKMLDPRSQFDVVGLLCPAWKPYLNMNDPLYWVCANNVGGQYIQNFDLNDGGLREVDVVGSGAILIARRVLEHPKMRAPFMDEFNELGIRKLGHDYNFCRRARKLGFHVWVGLDHICGHKRYVELLTIARMRGRWEETRKQLEGRVQELEGRLIVAGLISEEELLGPDLPADNEPFVSSEEIAEMDREFPCVRMRVPVEDKGE